MPELPEVETVRLDLVRDVVGRTIVAADVTGRRTVRRQAPVAFTAALASRRVESVGRHGKYLFARLDDASALVVHLRMSGSLQLVAGGAGVGREPHTHVVLVLDDCSELRFVDPRTFGELFVTGDVAPDGRPRALAALGVDPLLDPLDASIVRELVGRRRTALKAMLLDQRAIAGIGNIYGDEICFRARLRPDRRTESVSAGEASRLAGAVVEVLTEAVAARGSTLRDARYRDLRGGHGEYQHRHAVYGRAGEPCPRCGRAVERGRIAGRSSFLCPACQG